MAKWFTFRDDVNREPKSTGGQCPKITRFFCNGGAGRGTLSGTRSKKVYCKNADGYIVYCKDEYGWPSCENEATCTEFITPCNGALNRIDCSDATDGQTAAQFSDGAGGHTWVDATGRKNCAYKFGVMYRDFVDTCYSSFRYISGSNKDADGNEIGYAGRERINTQMWPCLPWVPSTSSGGAPGFSNYFQNSGGWKNYPDPDLELKNGVYSSVNDPGYINAKRGMRWPNALHSATGTTLNNDNFGVNPSSYLAMDMRPYIDPADGATFLHQNK